MRGDLGATEHAQLTGVSADQHHAQAHTVADHSDVYTVEKSADETVNNSATFQDDDELLFQLAANTQASFIFYVLYQSNSTADFKVRVRAGAQTLRYQCVYEDVGNAETVRTISGLADASGFDCIADTTIRAVVIHGYFATDGSNRSALLSWAQDTADVSDTKVLAGSWLRAWEI